MKLKFLLLPVILSVMLTGCASAPKGDYFSGVKPAKKDKTIVYIYRPEAYFAKALAYPILLNDNKIADLVENAYLTVELDPGSYTIQPNTDAIDNKLTFQANANEVIFLRLKTNRRPALCFCTSLEFELTDRRSGSAELSGMRQEIDRIY